MGLQGWSVKNCINGTSSAHDGPAFAACKRAAVNILENDADMPGRFVAYSIERVLLRSILERGILTDRLTYAMIEKDKPKMQLDDLPTILALYNIEKSKQITSISHISTIVYIFKSMPSAKLQCFIFHKIIKLCYAVPLSSTSCEHTFSTMCQLKTWL